jgi:hypothetical protein
MPVPVARAHFRGPAPSACTHGGDEMKGTIGPTAFLVIPLLMSFASASPQVNPQKRVSIAFADADPLDVFGMLARE